MVLTIKGIEPVLAIRLSHCEFPATQLGSLLRIHDGLCHRDQFFGGFFHISYPALEGCRLSSPKGNNDHFRIPGHKGLEVLSVNKGKLRKPSLHDFWFNHIWRLVR